MTRSEGQGSCFALANARTAGSNSLLHPTTGLGPLAPEQRR